jgi:putative heme-binding domain-containing protein
LLNVVLSKYQPGVPAYTSLVARLTTMVGAGGTTENIHQLIEKAASAKNASILQGLAEGLRFRKTPLPLPVKDQQLLVSTFFDNPSQEMRKASLQLLRAINITDSALKKNPLQRAATIMQDATQPAAKRAEAIEFIAIGDAQPFAEDLKKLIVPKEEFPVQLAALRTLSSIKGTAVSEFAIEQWPVLTPEIRNAAINTFMVDSQRTVLLIEALEKDKIKPSSLPFGTSVEIMQINNEDLRNRARMLFTKNERERKNVNKEYQHALELKGDAEKGKAVYQQNCAICHTVRGKIGVPIGPDLGTIHNWISEDIMANILDPNLSISSGFDLWEAQLNNGESARGIIASETPAAITLRNNGQLDRTINRQDIKSLKAMNISAMPSGFEKTINQQQMADLLAFLRQN